MLTSLNISQSFWQIPVSGMISVSIVFHNLLKEDYKKDLSFKHQVLSPYIFLKAYGHPTKI